MLHIRGVLLAAFFASIYFVPNADAATAGSDAGPATNTADPAAEQSEDANSTDTGPADANPNDVEPGTTEPDTSGRDTAGPNLTEPVGTTMDSAGPQSTDGKMMTMTTTGMPVQPGDQMTDATKLESMCQDHSFYQCVRMDHCKNYIFRTFHFGCSEQEACCEYTMWNRCMGGIYPEGKCVHKNNTAECKAFRSVSDCYEWERCCLN